MAGWLFFVCRSGGKEALIFFKKYSRAPSRYFYGNTLVEVEAGKKKEVDDEKRGSREGYFL